MHRNLGLVLRFVALIGIACLGLPLSALSALAQAGGQTWYVTLAGDDVAGGDLATRSGTLRFALAHAAAGDFVSFDQLDVPSDRIHPRSTLVVPAGVAVGAGRSGACGSYDAPLAILVDAGLSVNPVVRLEAGATLRNVNISGGDVGLKIAGGDVDVCGVSLGTEYARDEEPISRPPKSVALIVDGPAAHVHRQPGHPDEQNR